MRGKWKYLAAGGLLLLLWLGQGVWDYFDEDSSAHVSMRYQLQLFSASVYEFHEKKGRWPKQFDDLAETSLALKSPYWRSNVPGTVIFWPKDMNPDPKQNSSILLSYYKGGLFSQFGRVWVCWGDLRTEFVPTEVLRKAGH